MSIERLNKAATAAGFAMATPDDDPAAEVQVAKAEEPASRAMVVAEPARNVAAREQAARLTDWVKSYLPGVGWRAPA